MVNQRFFSYIALFTFAMLMLVMSDNFPADVLRLGRVGWSYLLIGFWYKRESAFSPASRLLVNRVGDFGFHASGSPQSDGFQQHRLRGRSPPRR